MSRKTASQITDPELDALYARLDLMDRALNRADAVADEWSQDPRPITRAEAAELLAAVIKLHGWDQATQRALRLVPAHPAPDTSEET